MYSWDLRGGWVGVEEAVHDGGGGGGDRDLAVGHRPVVAHRPVCAVGSHHK